MNNKVFYVTILMRSRNIMATPDHFLTIMNSRKIKDLKILKHILIYEKLR